MASKKTSAGGYQKLVEQMRKHIKWDKRRWPAGVKRKKDPKRDAQVDELVADVRTLVAEKKLPKADAFVPFVENLGYVLMGMGRGEDAMEMWELGRTIDREMTVWGAVLYMRTAKKLKDRAALERAIKGFKTCEAEGFAYAKERDAMQKFLKTLPKTPKKKAAAAKPTAKTTAEKKSAKKKSAAKRKRA